MFIHGQMNCSLSSTETGLQTQKTSCKGCAEQTSTNRKKKVPIFNTILTFFSIIQPGNADLKQQDFSLCNIWTWSHSPLPTKPSHPALFTEFECSVKSQQHFKNQSFLDNKSREHRSKTCVSYCWSPQNIKAIPTVPNKTRLRDSALTYRTIQKPLNLCKHRVRTELFESNKSN